MRGLGFQFISPWCIATQTLLALKLMTLCAAVTNSANITFSNEPNNKESTVDGFIMLTCSVSTMPANHHVVWTQNGKPIFEGLQPFGQHVRYRCLGEDTFSNLVIQPVAKEDHGSFFSCRIYDGSLLNNEEATLVIESRMAIVTVKYPPSTKYPLCQVNHSENNDAVNVVLSCCTEIVSVPMSLAWAAQGENASWRITQQASTGYETGQNCVDVDIESGLNFTAFQCQLDSLGDLENFKKRQCKIAKISSISISLKFLGQRKAEFNCMVETPGDYQYLWHLQDEEKTQIQQKGSLSSESTLVLQLNEVGNGSHLTCSVFDGLQGPSRAIGTGDLKIVLQAQPPGKDNPMMMIIGIVIGAVVGTLIFGLSVYFILVKCARRNDQYYASLERGSENGMQIGPGNTYIYKNGENGNMNGTVVTMEGGTIRSDAEEVPPKPGGHRTISWEPEDMIIRSNGGVINHTEDPTRRNVEGLVYADLAFKEGEEEQDAEPEGEQEEVLRGAVGGEANGSKPGTARQNSIEYASIVPPLRNLRFE